MNTHDSHETIFPADPRLTAYAFGELEGEELALIEAAVQASPELQATVAELRAFSGELVTALGDEKPDNLAAPIAAPKKRRGWVIPFPLHYLATAAAACFAVVVWMRYEKPAPVSVRVPLERAVAKTEALEPTPVAAVRPVHEAKAMVATVGSVATALPAAPEPEVKFDQVLAARAVASLPEAPAAAPSLFIAGKDSDAAAPASTTEGGMVAQGRRDYLAGNSAAAEATFQAVLAQAPANPEARSFAKQIQKERRAIADLNRSKVRSGMILEEASNSWQRPTGYVAPVVANAPMPVSDAESYATQSDNAYRTAATEPRSTFSVDVDTASYSNVRRFLMGGSLPPRDAVRVEELINYFPYRYTPPMVPPLGVGFAGEVVPFAAKLEVASAPWAPSHRLVRIGLKGRELTAATRPAANLVFLLDVSGSMNSANKLPLVKESLRLLVDRLRPDDRVAIVTYAGNSGLALPSTPAAQKREIMAALDNLGAGGSTNGAMGIHLAYDIAKANFATGGLNRVILCTDGDFNVGVTDRDELVRLITEKAKSRVFLSVFGYGMGNLKDNTLESLADKGNGAYGYIDSRREAEKVFVEQVEGTLATIAKDVKIQVEFNPARVAAYRLVGYENRMLAKEDFNNDAVDAGDIGAGHTVTALYEIVPVGVDAEDVTPRPAVDALKYQKPVAELRASKTKPTGSRELLTVKIRYKAPEGDVSKKQEFPLIDMGADFTKADGDFQFAAAVAAWGLLLRDSPHKGSASFEQVLGWAENGLGDDAGGYRAEFIQLVRRSAELK